MVLENEFEFNDVVYILKDSGIIKTRIRYVKFPDISRFNAKPTSSIIQYGCCTDKKLEYGNSIQETESWYDWRFASQIDRTKNELLDKLKDK